MQLITTADITDSDGTLLTPAGSTVTLVRMVESGLQVPDALVRDEAGREYQLPADDLEPAD